MGAHVVATRPISPQPWAPEKLQLLFVGVSVAFGVRTNCLSNFPPSIGQQWKFLKKILIFGPFTMMKYPM